MYKLAVFDMDGTLLDTLEDIAAATNHALLQYGYPAHPVESYRQFVGSGVHTMIKRALAPVTDTAATQKVEAVYRSYYALHAADNTKPYDGAADVLARLKAKGVAVCILSNKSDRYVKDLADSFFPGLTDLARGQMEGVPLKPDPAALLDILRQLGVPKNSCVYFGDSGVDMETGKAAGVRTIGVSWGFRTRDELLSAGADSIIDKTDDILQFFG